MKTTQISFTIESCLKNLKKLNEVMEAIASQIPLSSEKAFALELCLTEAVVNCIRHAYRGTPGYPIDIEIEQRGEKLSIGVRDRGISMNPRLLDSNRAVKQSDTLPQPGEVPTSGRGLMIMKTYMNEIRYFSDNGLNTLQLVMNLNAEGKK